LINNKKNQLNDTSIHVNRKHFGRTVLVCVCLCLVDISKISLLDDRLLVHKSDATKKGIVTADCMAWHLKNKSPSILISFCHCASLEKVALAVGVKKGFSTVRKKVSDVM